MNETTGVFFSSVTGSPDGDGTPARPFPNLQQAIQAATSAAVPVFLEKGVGVLPPTEVDVSLIGGFVRVGDVWTRAPGDRTTISCPGCSLITPLVLRGPFAVGLESTTAVVFDTGPVLLREDRIADVIIQGGGAPLAEAIVIDSAADRVQLHRGGHVIGGVFDRVEVFTGHPMEIVRSRVSGSVSAIEGANVTVVSSVVGQVDIDQRSSLLIAFTTILSNRPDAVLALGPADGPADVSQVAMVASYLETSGTGFPTAVQGDRTATISFARVDTRYRRIPGTDQTWVDSQAAGFAIVLDDLAGFMHVQTSSGVSRRSETVQSTQRCSSRMASTSSQSATSRMQR